VTKGECIEWLKKDVTDANPKAEIYGRKWDYGWGTCRYMMGVAATAIMAYDLDPTATDMLKIAKDQMNWIFGRNQFGMSFVVGNKADNWLTKYPLHPHHRAANPDGANVPELGAYTATELTGGTIGGPSAHTTFSDRWDDYTSTETGIDYWAGTFFTAAYLAQ
jgi:endoglucanase